MPVTIGGGTGISGGPAPGIGALFGTGSPAGIATAPGGSGFAGAGIGGIGGLPGISNPFQNYGYLDWLRLLANIAKTSGEFAAPSAPQASPFMSSAPPAPVPGVGASSGISFGFSPEMLATMAKMLGLQT